MTKDKKSEVVINNPHNAVFKKVMEDESVVKELIRNNLLAEMIQDLDQDTMKLVDGSFISEELCETFSDVIYGAEVAGHDVYITFLFEHKSSADKSAIFQVRRYMIYLWERLFQKREEVLIVFLIIYYHGEAGMKHAESRVFN